jgi:hypothetical protein
MNISLIALLFFVLSTSTIVFGACPDITVKTFANDLASAHVLNRIGSLDEKYPDFGSIQIFIEHSIGEEENGDTIFIAAVRSFRDLAKLLESRRTDGLPAPGSRPLRKCSNSVCTYDFLNGIQHNKLYLKEIRYNDYKSCLEIEAIWFLDGD